MTLPPLPESFPAGYIAQTEYFFTADQMQAYGQQCALAERERILKIAYEQSTAYGKTGECMWIGIKANVRNGK